MNEALRQAIEGTKEPIGPIPRARYSLLGLAVTLFLVLVLLVWYAWNSYRVFEQHQRQLAKRSVDAATAEISLFLDGLRRSLTLFAEEHRGLLAILADDPDDDVSYSRLEAAVASHFPDYFAFVIAGPQGEILLDDFDGSVSERCSSEIRRFVSTRQQVLSIHPHPEGYHFDVMVPWSTPEGEPRTFFVSFLTPSIARILADGQAPGHELMLIHRDIAGLVEVSAEGARNVMHRPFKLTAEELGRVDYHQAVAGTHWDLAALPDPAMLAARRDWILGQVLVTLLGFLILSAVVVRLIKQEEARRVEAERALQRSHAELAARVEERTRQLLVANRELEQEIAERKRAQEQAQRQHQTELIHAWRLNTMGELALQLAHEVNQPLAAIVNYTRGCVRRLRSGEGSPEELTEAMEGAAAQAELAGRIVRRFRGHLRKAEPQRAPFDPTQVIRDVLHLVEGEGREARIAVRTELSRHSGLVSGDRIQIEQVLLNLIRNAIGAMSDTAPGQRCLTVSAHRAANELVLAVRDTGRGLPGEDPQRVFERFFTTKRDGMGMGLPISKTIIEEHGGRLWATPNEGPGTTFWLTLPLDGPE